MGAPRRAGDGSSPVPGVNQHLSEADLIPGFASDLPHKIEYCNRAKGQ